ncbi:class I SAM-dependent methyltransferase [Fructilactobacillus carniphilus]|uniref:Class I SAM-dependent methyltransferase n=1 Tax=Fructilactobacillus carniphilus TaxID=2940297 RepID=A0ABY5BZ16_9LACO|nr:class I SAM-dependent methyltransferase [Fructilactobacillus carniphilus]USS91322.1 class I SAM-dependent methyltransferase [Fructilactobacillus carniphilus]
MRAIEITGAAASKIEGGYPKLSLKDLEQPVDATDNGEFVALQKSGHFVASAYLAQEGNGIGWILSRKENQAINAAFFEQLFQKAFQLRAPLVGQRVTAYRLFNGIGDGLGGLAIDNFDGQILLTWENAGLYHQRAFIMDALNQVLDEYKGVYELKRYQAQAAITPVTDLAAFPQQQQVVTENGINYEIQLAGGMKPGLDLAYREVRHQLKNNSHAKLALHLLFDQTGFVTASIIGGAVQSEAVDQKNSAKTNLVAELSANEITQKMPKVRTMDLLGYLDYATKHELKFDVITINLPAFLRSKKGNFNIRKDLNNLLQQVFTLATKEADVFITTETPAVTIKGLRQAAQTALQQLGQSFIEKEAFKQPLDFPFNPEYQRESPIKGLWFKFQR